MELPIIPIRTLPIKPFAKGHDPLALGRALSIPDRAARQAAIDAVPLSGFRKLINPSAGWGSDASDALGVGAPPEDDSLQTAEELAEIAGILLLADVPMDGIAKHADAARLTDTLLALGGTTLVEPRPGGLFRLNASRMGGRTANLLSTGYPTGWAARGSYLPTERIGFYGNSRNDWEALQAGTIPRPQTFGPIMPTISTPRAWASLVDADSPFTIPELIGRELVRSASPSARFVPRRTEAGFPEYGGACWVQTTIGEACGAAMRECWRLKWLHRRQRPEELWPRAVAGELHPAFLEHAGWLVERIGEYLPMVYAPGSPLHPDWPSGHAVLAGAGFTILKAAFADQPFGGNGSLHRELDLAAWVMSFGRTAAGIHTRSSLIAGLMLGQHHALQVLAKQNAMSPQPLGDTVIQGFDGQRLRITGTDS